MNRNEAKLYFKELCKCIADLNVKQYEYYFKYHNMWNLNFVYFQFMKNKDGDPLLFSLLKCVDGKRNKKLIRKILKITFETAYYTKSLSITFTKNSKNKTLFEAAIIKKHESLFYAIIKTLKPLQLEILLKTKINENDNNYNDYPLIILIKLNMFESIKKLFQISYAYGIIIKMLSLGEFNAIHATIKYSKPHILRFILKFPHINLNMKYNGLLPIEMVLNQYCFKDKEEEIKNKFLNLLDPNKRIQQEINEKKFDKDFFIYNQTEQLKHDWQCKNCSFMNENIVQNAICQNCNVPMTQKQIDDNRKDHTAISMAKYLTMTFKAKRDKYHGNVPIKRSIDFLALCPITLNNEYFNEKMENLNAKITEKYWNKRQNKNYKKNKIAGKKREEFDFIADIFWRKDNKKSFNYKKEENKEMTQEIISYFQGRKLIHRDVVIGNISDPNHPCKQSPNHNHDENVFGLFATNYISKNEVICLYNGEFNFKQEIYNKYNENDDNQFRLYTMEYHHDLKDKDDSNSICIDSNIFCNHGVLINDPKNHNKQNEANVIYKEGHIDGIPFVALITSKSIKRGQELLTDYSDAFWNHYNRIKYNVKDQFIENVPKKEENQRKRKLDSENMRKSKKRRFR